MAAKKAATKAAKKKNGATKKKSVSVRKNGKTLYGIIAQRILAKRAAAAKKRANSSAKTKPAKKKNTVAKAKVKPIVKRANTAKAKAAKVARTKRRNAADYSPSTPISVTRHFRSGGPGYMTQRERIIKAGQRDMFAPQASMNELLGFLRKNPTVLTAVQKKLGKRFATASNSELKKIMRQVALSALGKGKAQPGAKAPAKRKSNPPRRRNSAEDVHKMFLGREVEFEYEVEAPKNTPTDLAKLGVLTRLVIIDKDDPRTLIELTFDDVAQMAPDLCADGRGNLHVVGGTYRIEPKGVWGEIEKIGYLAAKDHLDGKEYEWIHTFGEEGGTRPRFKADDEGFIHIVGGDYTLEAAGIRD